MKLKNNIMPKASIVVIIFLMFSSAFVSVQANSQYLMPERSDISASVTDGNRDDVIWDNGMTYGYYSRAIWDEINNFDHLSADDFMFTEFTVVQEVHWVGGYFDDYYEQGDFDWIIAFYTDQGDGNAPGDLLLWYSFTHQECNPVIIEDTGWAIFINFSITLPENLYFQENTKYWIALYGVGLTPPISCWGIHGPPLLLHEGVVGSDYMGIPYWTGIGSDMCFQLLSSLSPDLNCEGSLSWNDIEPGSVVTGSFNVENIGDPVSFLDWEVTEWPEWGTWVFEPEDGEDLTPEDGAFPIEVTVIAPDVEDENFAGHITLQNSEDSNDFCIIDVSLATPINQQVDNHHLFKRILWHFPHSFPVLRHILGIGE